ncbi:uncharacterized protein LAJ45_10578 [Morchella importuna]|uniref:uncharacterized protein n=1 Tax=Morchella importuna TaxID=1174673 RepID=UPI001E8D5871|nr:uncharacterized protein LAJ45_10578 [Morchella importuna]KAH8145456.1 hypothetical protein LAJ45_10578 [Morchella importuna]
MSAPAGTARIIQGEGNFLTQFNDNAVVGLGQEREWKIRPAHTNNGDAIVITLKDDNSEEKCLTLDSNSDSDVINILVRPLESPPRPEQMWTIEDAIMQPRFPPIVHGRLQSVAEPAAVPHDDGDMDRFRWRMDYMSMSD